MVIRSTLRAQSSGGLTAADSAPMQFPPLTLPCIGFWVMGSAPHEILWRTSRLYHCLGMYGGESSGAKQKQGIHARIWRKACRARMGKKRGGELVQKNFFLNGSNHLFLKSLVPL